MLPRACAAASGAYEEPYSARGEVPNSYRAQTVVGMPDSDEGSAQHDPSVRSSEVVFPSAGMGKPGAFGVPRGPAPPITPRSAPANDSLWGNGFAGIESEV